MSLSSNSQETAIIAASIPDTPAAPTTSVNSNVSVTVTWTAPYNGGSVINSYFVTIRQNDEVTYSAHLVNCDGN